MQNLSNLDHPELEHGVALRLCTSAVVSTAKYDPHHKARQEAMEHVDVMHLSKKGNFSLSQN